MSTTLTEDPCLGWAGAILDGTFTTGTEHVPF
jgi:hypothetical protein